MTGGYANDKHLSILTICNFFPFYFDIETHITFMDLQVLIQLNSEIILDFFFSLLAPISTTDTVKSAFTVHYSECRCTVQYGHYGSSLSLYFFG